MDESSFDPKRALIEQRLFPSVVHSPVQVGRFVLLSQLGAGGMGEVYSAYDEQLDRRVAIKLLRADASDHGRARERLLREAKVLARLSHPNVVQIHDAGVVDERVFIAMELVDGQTLGSWLDEHAPPVGDRRRWPVVVERFLQAGRGLAAAHELDLIHRDFKPDNVLVGSDGRVRVVDFGLARPVGAEPSVDTATTLDERRPSETSSRGSGSQQKLASLTRTGSILGTIAYMAPEQMEGRTVDGRSDQFSFCVALFEAIYGERPYSASSLAARIVALDGGRLPQPKSLAAAPRWLHRALVRGLALSPDERFVGMEDLLDALDRRRSGRRWASGLLIGGSAMAAGVALASGTQPTEEPCAAVDDALEQAWDDGARDRAEAAFSATALPYADAAAERVMAQLDERVAQWRDEQRDACEATHVRHAQSDEQLDLRMMCIDRHLPSLRVVIERMQRADATTVEHAAQTVSDLPSPSSCQDPEALRLGVRPPDDPEAVAELRGVRAEVMLMVSEGRLDEARQALPELLTRAETTGYAPARAEALLTAARLQLERGSHEDRQQAALMLWDALDLAEGSRHDAIAAEVWLAAADHVGRLEGKPAEGLQRVRRARAAAERAPIPRHVGFDLRMQAGRLHVDAGEIGEGIRILEQGRAEAEAEPRRAFHVARFDEALAGAYERAGEIEAARRAYERADAAWQEVLGADHPHRASLAFNFATFSTAQGQEAQAREQLEQARRLWERAHGPRFRGLGRVELALADLEQRAGRLDQAMEHLQRATAILDATLPDGHPQRAEALGMLGLVSFRRERYTEAYDAWTLALEQLVGRGEDAPEVLMMRSNLGEALLGQERYAEARALYADLEPRLPGGDDDDPLLRALVLKGVGLAELGLGHPALARPPLARAEVLMSSFPGLELELADVAWARARARHDDGLVDAETERLARRAAEQYGQHGNPGAQRRVDAWLTGRFQP